MSNPPIQVTTDLSKLLDQINTKLKMLQKEVTTFRTETKVARSVKGDINTLKVKVNNLKDIKESQKAQIWTLIGILSTAIVETVIQFVIAAIPSNP
jgi:prefoldin subunit 5